MARLGADVDSLDALAQVFVSAGAQLGQAAGSLTTALGGVTWTGPDADQFRTTWRGRHAPRLREVARVLDDIVATIREQAGQQRQASAVDVGGGHVADTRTPTPSQIVRLLQDSLGSPSQIVRSLEDSLGSPSQIVRSLEDSLGSPSQIVRSLEDSLGSPSQIVRSLEDSLGSPSQIVRSLEDSLGSHRADPDADDNGWPDWLEDSFLGQFLPIGPKYLHAGPDSPWTQQGQGYDPITDEILTTYYDQDDTVENAPDIPGVLLSIQDRESGSESTYVHLTGADGTGGPMHGGGVSTDGEFVYVVFVTRGRRRTTPRAWRSTAAGSCSPSRTVPTPSDLVYQPFDSDEASTIGELSALSQGLNVIGDQLYVTSEASAYQFDVPDAPVAIDVFDVSDFGLQS